MQTNHIMAQAAKSGFVGMWILLALTFGQCSQIDVENPIATDTTTVTVPAFRVVLDSNGTGGFSLDTLIRKYPDFSIRFDPMANGQFVVDAGKREARFVKTKNDWTQDSTLYHLCASGKCTTGKVWVRNYIKMDTSTGCDSLNPIGPITVALLGQVLVPLSPRLSWGKITELRPGFYSGVSILTSDSTKIQYRAVGSSIFYGFDEVGYTLLDSLGQCHRGIVRFIIGDGCDNEAADDQVTVSGVLAQWSAVQFLSNELSPCSIPLDGFQFRLRATDPDYQFATVVTPNGRATDTLIGGNQVLYYRKTNLAATRDSLWYYLYDRDNSLRMSRAKIRINFQ